MPIEEQIRRLEHAHGIRTDAERILELSLFMEDKFRDIAMLSRQPRPETIFDGPEGWASWLDARLFAKQNLHREMSVDLMREIHRRLLIRGKREYAGRMRGPAPRYGWGSLHRPASPSEVAALEENRLLTFVPGPFRAEPYGAVLHPKAQDQPGARSVRWLDTPPTETELAAISDDPLLGYVEPGTLRPHGVIIYPVFGSADIAHEFHERLCDRYDKLCGQPGHGPHRRAAEFQKRLVSMHSWWGGVHGRHSRILMHFALEQAGEPPSAVAEFDNDLLTSLPQWSAEVKAGCDRYGRWQDKLERAGGDIDPLELFDLEPMMWRYQRMGGASSPFKPGELHDTWRYEQLHRHLRSET
ncbi:hypothetical protein [Nocardia brasiliensis]|uniref:hypothetical protein n=1 Tax=Nocardia brasiliensis TaxID=37326 RepID=UPI0024562B3B|nr:hypothetical protein [Nocardia brasiliensis]